MVSIEWLRERARLLTGEPQPIEFTDRVVAAVRYRDGPVIDVVHQVRNKPCTCFLNSPATMRCQFPSCSSAGMKGHGNTPGLGAILFHWSPLPWLRLGQLKTAEVTRRIFNHGVTALRALAAKQGWQIREQAALVSASGPEGMLSIAAPARDLALPPPLSLNIIILSGGYGISMS